MASSSGIKSNLSDWINYLIDPKIRILKVSIFIITFLCLLFFMQSRFIQSAKFSSFLPSFFLILLYNIY